MSHLNSAAFRCITPDVKRLPPIWGHINQPKYKMIRNVIGNISEMTDVLTCLGGTSYQSLEEIIDYISNLKPSDTLLVPLKGNHSDIIFQFQKKTPEGVCVYLYTNTVS